MKKRLNVKLVAWVLGGAAVLAIAAYFLHSLQVRRNAVALRHLAEAAESNNELDRAIRYYRIYIYYVPTDTEALVRLGKLYVKLQTAPGRLAALERFETVLRRWPERHDIRRLLVEQAIHPDLGEQRRYTDAIEHLDVLCREFPEEGGLKLMLGRCQEALGQFSDAEASYAESIQLTPTLLDGYRCLANLQLNHLQNPAAATGTFNQLVAANPQQAQAWLYRAQFLRMQSHAIAREEDQKALLDQAAGDLAQAIRFGERDADVLFESFELALTRGQVEQARAFVQRGLENHDRDPRFHLAGARLENRRKEAIVHLRRGLAQSPNNHELLLKLAVLVVEERNWQEAKSIEEKLRTAGTPAPLLDYLKARVLVEKGQWLEASLLLEKTRTQLPPWPEFAIQADLELAWCHRQLGDTTQAEFDLSRALTVNPSSESACMGLGDLLIAKGRYAKAFAVFRTAAPSTSRSRFRSAQALILHNLSLPAKQRRWEDVESLLTALGPDPVELALLRADILAGKDQLAQAGQELAAAAVRHPRTTALWTARAALLQRQEKWQEALALLDEAEKKIGNNVDLSLARIQFCVERGGSPASLRALAVDVNRFDNGDWQRLTGRLAEAWLQLGDTGEAARLCTRLADKDRHNLSVRLVLFDLALAANQGEDARRILAEMRLIEGAEGAHWRLGEALNLLDQASLGQKEPPSDVRQLLTEIAARRSDWTRLTMAEADWEKLRGRPEAAIRKYRQALESGDHGPKLVRRLAVLLYERRRFLEAEELLQKLPPAAPALLSGLDGMAAGPVLLRTDGGRASPFALKSAAADCKDYRELVWLGHMLGAAGKRQDAEAVFRRAVELGDKAPETWLALVGCLQQNQEKAEAVLAAARAKLPADQVLLTLAQGRELLGQPAKAAELYEAAREARPDDLAVLRGLAWLTFRTRKLDDAARHLRTILALEKISPEDVDWARRLLAFALAADGDRRKASEALAVLGIHDETRWNDMAAGLTAAEQRTIAMVLAAPRSQLQSRRAITLLEKLVRKEGLDSDRFLLAELLQLVGSTRSADEQILRLLAETPDEPRYLACHIQSLLGRKLLDDAELFVASYERCQPGAVEPLIWRARLLHARGKGAQAVPLLRTLAESRPDQLPLAAALLEELGQADAAEELLRKWVRRAEKPEHVLVLARFLGRRQRADEGLSLCADAWKNCPAEAVAEASVAVLLTGQATADQYAQVAESLEKARANTSVLRALALVRLEQQRYADSIGLYEDLIRRDPQDAFALNNLAWLLVLHQGKGAQALELIQQAIKLAGPSASLLDTRAVILLALGQTAAAIGDLEDVVAEAPSAGRHFHLARAYLRAGQRDAALASWQRALAAGLRPATIDPLEAVAYQDLAGELAR